MTPSWTEHNNQTWYMSASNSMCSDWSSPYIVHLWIMCVVHLFHRCSICAFMIAFGNEREGGGEESWCVEHMIIYILSVRAVLRAELEADPSLVTVKSRGDRCCLHETSGEDVLITKSACNRMGIYRYSNVCHVNRVRPFSNSRSDSKSRW